MYDLVAQIDKDLDATRQKLIPTQVPSANASTTPDTDMTQRSIKDALTNNLSVRLLWDQLLTTQQQITATRLKTRVLLGVQEMEAVTKDVNVDASATANTNQQ